MRRLYAHKPSIKPSATHVVITLTTAGPLTTEEQQDDKPYEPDTDAPCRYVSIRAAPEARGTHVQLWEGGTLLCRYLEEIAHTLPTLNILELGAGLGACGIKAIALGAKHVVLTDLPEAMPILECNVRRNLTTSELHRASTCAYTWGQSRADLQAVHPHPFDLILCGDLVYHPELVRPLLDALDALAPNDATAALLACRSRPGKMPQQEAVLTGLQALGFRLTRVAVDCTQRGTYLVRARRPTKRRRAFSCLRRRRQGSVRAAL